MKTDILPFGCPFIWPFTIHSSQVFATSQAGRASTLMEVSNLFREVTELCAQKDGTADRRKTRVCLD